MNYQGRRILSFLLVMVLLASELACVVPPVAYAEETLGDTSVSETPEELLSMGEWQYWVEGDIAIVAGYSNPDEAALTIPYQLGGFPVAGIGHHAFSSNSGLRDITIHTNVTRIARDAFAGCNEVTISAYHGAYALRFAEELGLENRCISSSAITFANGVLDLSGINPKAYSHLSEVGVTFEASQATFLQEGQILYFPATKDFPTGLARKVSTVVTSGRTMVASLVEIEMGEAFDAVSGEAKLYLDWDHAIYPEGITEVHNVSSESIIYDFYDGEIPPLSDRRDLQVNIEVGDHVTIEGQVGLSITASAQFEILRVLLFHWSLQEANVTARVDLDASLDLKVNGNVLDEPIKGIDFFKKTHEPIISVPFFTTGFFSGYIEVDLLSEIEGGFSLSFRNVTIHKYQFRNGKWTHSSTPIYSIIDNASAELSIKLGPELDISIDVGIAELVEFTLLELDFSLYAEGRGSLTSSPVTGAVSGVECIEISIGLYFEVNVKVGIVKFTSKIGRMEFDIEACLKFDIAKVTIWNPATWHWEKEITGLSSVLSHGMRKVEKCRLTGRRVVFDPGNGQGKFEQIHDVNSFFSPPQNPWRSGYRFDGWYVDTARSGLSGKDYQFNFWTMPMPYIANNGALYLYTSWYDLYPVTSISLDKSSITGFSNVGATEKVNITSILPTNANNKQVRWSSSNANVATVDQYGNVKLKNAGTATITCSSVGNPSAKASCSVTVKQSVTGIELNTNNIFRYSDNMSGIQLSANVQPSNAADKSVTWTSSNTAVATVSGAGYITLKGLGTATITCRSVSNPNVTATCDIAVRQAVTGIKLDRTDELRTNADMSSRKLTATVSPSNAYNKALNWSSSDENVATVSPDGTVTMKGVGTTKITCASVSNPGITATFNLQIIQAVREIILNKKAVTLYSDEKNPVQLSTTILPADAGNKAVTWESSNPAVVTVSSTGSVSVVAAGEAVVTCRSVSNPDVTAECRFTILQAVTGIDLNITSINTTSDEINLTYLKATVSPANAYNKAVTWESSNSKVATVSSDGIVALKGVGHAEITCRSVSTPYITATCSVDIVQAVTGLTLSEKSILRYSNQKDGIQLIATLEAAELSDREVRWTTSNANVATVSASGIVSIKNPGTAVITCTSVSNPDVSDECLVTVRQSVTGISLNKTAVEKYSDQLGTVQLTATVTPSSAANKDLRWNSSDLAVATVTEDGLLTLVGPGTAVITCSSASDPEISAKCSVTVYQAVNSLKLNINHLTRTTAEASIVQLTAYALPSYAQNKDVSWASNNQAVAKVSASGLVTITGTGTVTITCTCVSRPELSAVCTITVLQAVSSVSLDRQNLILFNDETAAVQLNAVIMPTNAVNKDLIWSSSNPSILQVSDTGELSIAGTGTAVITCRAVGNPAASATCHVTVKQAVQSIILNESALELYADDTRDYQIAANVQPAYADNKAVTWTSSDSRVVCVSENGSLTIHGVGNATITCTSSVKPSVSAQCSVLVKQPMESISLDKDTVSLYSDDENGVQLTAAISPSNIDDTDILWVSDNETVALVSGTGLVQAVGVGTATISCRSARNPESISASCSVTVMQRVEAVTIEGNTSSLLPRETAQLTAHCYPEFAQNMSVIWQSDNPQVASVSNTGLITALSYGTAVITVSSTDGGNALASYTMKVEPELVLEPTISQEILYAQGNSKVIIANVHIGDAAVRRMVEAGYEPTWSLSKPDDHDDVQMEIYPTTAEDRGDTYETSYVILSGSSFEASGSRTYTVTCSAGPYSASSDILIKVDNTEAPTGVTLSPSTFTVGIGEPVMIPGAALSADGKPVPVGMTISGISGDEYFINAGSCVPTENGYAITFAQSGVYTAVVHYAGRNMSYDVNVSFYVRDENGIIRIRTESLTLDESYLVMVEGTSRKLTCAARPIDAYDSSVTWTSSDESIATVDQNGIVTALKPGRASISCSANDDFSATAICAVTVESFLQLDDSELSYTVYTGGNDHAELGIVNVTLDSEKRLLDAGLNVTWSLEKLSGDACDIAVEEFRAEAENGITVSGNRIKLLRLHDAGEAVYRLACRAGEYSDSCFIRIQVVEAALPDAITLNQSDYSGTVSEVIIVDTGYSSAELPSGTLVRIRGGNAFENALSEAYDFTEPEKLIFDAPGTFSASIVFTGDNYTYTCPITVTVCDEDGNVPVNITDICITPESVNLILGEQAELACYAEPADAMFSTPKWTSSDTSVATVSSTGKVTAISAGIAFISVSVPESDFVGGCMVTVEDGLTLQKNSVDRTVFVDGITRTQLDTVQLTSASSQRLSQAPEWQLMRVDGNNMTLKVKEYNTVDINGNMIYGCAINLFSLSRDGDTEYELICKAGEEAISIPVIVHAQSRSREIPSGLTFTQNTFTASVNELIRVVPDIICLPEGTALPDGMRVTLEGTALFESSINWDDYCVSQRASTLSFNRAGLFEANFIYSYSNMRYVVPVTFRITDANGNVPVLASSVSLSSHSLWLEEGETAKLNAVFTPANADDTTVSWVSTDPSIVRVDQDGNVTAVRKGRAEIICTPADSYLSPMICTVWVEDFIALETSETQIHFYKQGKQINEVFSAILSEGTIQRLSKAGLVPEWELSRTSGDHTEVTVTTPASGDSLLVTSAALLSGGSDTYRVTCTAGEHSVSVEFTVEVIELGNIAETVSLTQTMIKADVGQTITVDFTPVCSPSGTVIPQNEHMWSLYAGLGREFYDALDESAYAENGNRVTLRFTKPGRYLFSRQFFLDNIHYAQVCEIEVGQADTSCHLLRASNSENTVYLGGTAGKITEVNVTDTILFDVFDEKMTWSLERVSGDSLDVIMKRSAAGVELYTVGAAHAGNDIWRVTCHFDGYTESLDIPVQVRQPRSPVPESVTLSVNQISGMMGNWLSLPIAVSCQPSGSDLPETGDDFWSFEPVGMAVDVCQWEIEDGILRVKFLWPGYYTGILRYEAGNFIYSLPVYLTISDEEGVVPQPTFGLYLTGMATTVYASGQSNVDIGFAEVSHSLGTYYAGESDSYMNTHKGNWSIAVTSGTAASLSVEQAGNNGARLILNDINGTGKICYQVSCTVDGITYTANNSLTVLESSTVHPDPSLLHTTYYAVTGQPVTISTLLYERSSGAILQGNTKWLPDAVLPAIGYEYTETEESLQMVFYKDGTFNSSILATIGNLTYELPFTVVVSQAPATHNNTFKLPKALTIIDDYAFEGIRAECVDLRDSKVSRIGEGAFKNCTDLTTIYIPTTVTEISSTAFYGCLNVVIVCEPDSAADIFARQHNIPVKYQ